MGIFQKRELSVISGTHRSCFLGGGTIVNSRSWNWKCRGILKYRNIKIQSLFSRCLQILGMCERCQLGPKNWMNQRNSRSKTLSFCTSNSAICVQMYQIITNKHHINSGGIYPFSSLGASSVRILFWLQWSLRNLGQHKMKKKNHALYQGNFLLQVYSFLINSPFSKRGKSQACWAIHTHTVGNNLYYSECLPEQPAMTVWLLNGQLGNKVREFQGLSWLVFRISC